MTTAMTQIEAAVQRDALGQIAAGMANKPIPVPPLGQVTFVAWDAKALQFETVQLPEGTPNADNLRPVVYQVRVKDGEELKRLEAGQKPTPRLLEGARFVRVE